jgi:hypothetical protein
MAITTYGCIGWCCDCIVACRILFFHIVLPPPPCTSHPIAFTSHCTPHSTRFIISLHFTCHRSPITLYSTFYQASHLPALHMSPYSYQPALHIVSGFTLLSTSHSHRSPNAHVCNLHISSQPYHTAFTFYQASHLPALHMSPYSYQPALHIVSGFTVWINKISEIFPACIKSF